MKKTVRRKSRKFAAALSLVSAVSMPAASISAYADEITENITETAEETDFFTLAEDFFKAYIDGIGISWDGGQTFAKDLTKTTVLCLPIPIQMQFLQQAKHLTITAAENLNGLSVFITKVSADLSLTRTETQYRAKQKNTM